MNQNTKPKEHVHKWDEADSLDVAYEDKGHLIWFEKEYCDLCHKVRMTEFHALKDKNGQFDEEKLVDEYIRVQTMSEMKNSPH